MRKVSFRIHQTRLDAKILVQTSISRKSVALIRHNCAHVVQDNYNRFVRIWKPEYSKFMALALKLHTARQSTLILQHLQKIF